MKARPSALVTDVILVCPIVHAGSVGSMPLKLPGALLCCFRIFLCAVLLFFYRSVY